MSDNIPEYSVTELAGQVKKTVEDAFGYVRVRGELGRVTRAGSGHVYLDLKDDRAALSSVIWKGAANRMKIAPEQGMEVIATGRMTTFPGQSRYQLVIDTLEPAGAGALMALFEARKKALAAEGLFDPAVKKPLPYLPRVIGVVTSPSGAVIRDILHRLRDRFPSHVIVWPTLVQGDTAAPKIIAGINGFNALPPGGPIPRPDLLIVARGGGSLEDLWCFNDEGVARAAAASAIPLISAVGHETDTTLIDFVADQRAPTPTAAAEMAVPVRVDLHQQLEARGARLSQATLRLAERHHMALTAATRGLGRPEGLIEPAEQRLDRAADRLVAGLRQRLDRAAAQAEVARGGLSPAHMRGRVAMADGQLAAAAQRLAQAPARRVERAQDRLAAARLPVGAVQGRVTRAMDQVADRWPRLGRRATETLTQARRRIADQARLLESYSYKSVLDRGFTLVVGADGAVIRRAASAPAGGDATLRFADGDRPILWGDTPAGGAPPSAPQKARTPKSAAAPTPKTQGGGQGGLFD